MFERVIGFSPLSASASAYGVGGGGGEEEEEERMAAAGRLFEIEHAMQREIPSTSVSLPWPVQ